MPELLTRRQTIKASAVAALTLFLVWWLPHRGDYTHVVLIQMNVPNPGQLSAALRSTPPTRNESKHLNKLLPNAAVFSDDPSAVAPPQVPGKEQTADEAEWEGGLADQAGKIAATLRANGFNTGAVLSQSPATAKLDALKRSFQTMDVPTTGIRNAKQTFHAAHRWLWRDSRTKAPAFLFFGVEGPLPYTDRWVGELLNQLEIHGYFEEALIVVTASHANAPLAMRFPGDRYAGVRLQTPVDPKSIHATLLDYLRLENDTGAKSLLAQLNP